MDSDFSEKLKSVLSNPEAMSKIMAIASDLGFSGDSGTQGFASQAEAAPKGSVPTESIQNPLPSFVFPQESTLDPRIALLTSLRPLVREEKRERLDALARALSIASVMKNIRK